MASARQELISEIPGAKRAPDWQVRSVHAKDSIALRGMQSEPAAFDIVTFRQRSTF